MINTQNIVQKDKNYSKDFKINIANKIQTNPREPKIQLD